MKTYLLIPLLTAALSLSSCDKPATKPAPAAAAVPSAPEPWRARYDQLKTAVKIGMTEDEVTKAVGEPKGTYSYYGGGTTTMTWEYELPGGGRFAVRFGKGNKVVYADFDSATKVY